MAGSMAGSMAEVTIISEDHKDGNVIDVEFVQSLSDINNQVAELAQRKTALLLTRGQQELGRLLTDIKTVKDTGCQLHGEYNAARQRLEKDYIVAKNRNNKVRSTLEGQYLTIWRQLYPTIYEVTVNWNGMNHSVRSIGEYTTRKRAQDVTKKQLPNWYYAITPVTSSGITFSEAQDVDTDSTYPDINND